MTYHVYCFWTEDRRPLYVGFTNNLRRRMREHDRGPWLRSASFITVTPFDSEREARDAEVERVQSLRPAQNIAHHPAYRIVHTNPAHYYENDEDFGTTAYWRKRAAIQDLRRAAA